MMETNFWTELTKIAADMGMLLEGVLWQDGGEESRRGGGGSMTQEQNGGL